VAHVRVRSIHHNWRVPQVWILRPGRPRTPILRAPKNLLLRVGTESDPCENILFRHALMQCDDRENRVQRPDAQRRVCGNSDPMRRWLLGLQNDVAPDLMNPLVSPMLAKVLDQALTAQIARQLHATASTSSRTRRRRIEAGGTESK
jgi:hypothetical protein